MCVPLANGGLPNHGLEIAKLLELIHANNGGKVCVNFDHVGMVHPDDHGAILTLSATGKDKQIHVKQTPQLGGIDIHRIQIMEAAKWMKAR